MGYNRITLLNRITEQLEEMMDTLSLPIGKDAVSLVNTAYVLGKAKALEEMAEWIVEQGRSIN